MKRRRVARLLGSRLPKTSGTLHVEGARGEITIGRDANGIPHITAGDDLDASFAVGFCHGQDRTFQLEMLRRVMRGTVSALVGKRGLRIDRLSRRIGFHRGALDQLSRQTDDTRELFAAYSAGVSAGGGVGLRRRPHEFVVLRSSPSPWEAEDGIGMLKLVGFMLSTNWSAKLARLRILLDDGPDALRDLEPVYDASHPLISPPGVAAGPALARLDEELTAFESVVGTGLSNNWVIGADRTATGLPIVANDPHLNPTIPSQWYLAHVRTPEWEAAGATFAGAPGIIAGHNGFGAWGVTNGMADLCDLWIEQLGPEPGTVLRDGSWVRCECRDEVIEVRGGDPVAESILVTDRGPVIGPALDGEVGAVAFNAAWLSSGTVRGFLDAHKCRDFDAFRSSFRDWPSASLNVVYGDASGRIGWQFTGEIPVRSGRGALLPMPAWESGTAWAGASVPFEQMPHESATEGAIATANNKPVADSGSSSGPYLGNDWSMGYRARRIHESLDERDDWDVESTLRLQTDQVSLPWREVRGLLTQIDASNDPDVELAMELLRSWDGVVTPDAAGAAVFELFLHNMAVAVVRAKAPRAWEWALGRGPHAIVPFNTLHSARLPHLVRLLREQPPGWFEHSEEFARDAWTRMIRQCLAGAVARLRDRFGTDTSSWSWGEFRPLRIPHMLGGADGPLSAMFDLGPFPWGGDITCVNMCGSNPIDVNADPILMPTLRMVVQVGDWDAARFVLSGGQSGNPASPHYDDMFELWRCGGAVRIPWSQEAVASATVDVLRLFPALPAAD